MAKRLGDNPLFSSKAALTQRRSAKPWALPYPKRKSGADGQRMKIL